MKVNIVSHLVPLSVWSIVSWATILLPAAYSSSRIGKSITPLDDRVTPSAMWFRFVQRRESDTSDPALTGDN